MEDFYDEKHKKSAMSYVIGAIALPPADQIAIYERMGKPKFFKGRLFHMPHVYSCDKADLNVASTKRKALMFEAYRPFLGHSSILFQEGDKARKERSMLNRGFGQQTYRTIHPMMVDAAQRMRNRMLNDTQSHGSFEIEKLVSRATLEIIAQGGFSLDAQKDENIVYLDALKKMLRIPGNPICMLPYGTELVEWWNKDSLNKVKELLNMTISKRLDELALKPQIEGAEPAPMRDLLDLVIVSSRHTGGEGHMDINWIRDQVQLLFIGGSDTSSVTLHWGFILLAAKQDVQRKLKEEIKRVFAETDNMYDRMSKLTYTEAFIKEVLRMYAPFGSIGRALNDDDPSEWKGIPIFDRRWSNICYYSTLAHRRDEYFPRPNEFTPERWLEGKADSEAFGAFSAGFRACLGKNFAMIEMKTLLSAVFEKHTLFPVEANEGKLPPWGPVGQVMSPLGEWPLVLVSDDQLPAKH